MLDSLHPSILHHLACIEGPAPERRNALSVAENSAAGAGPTVAGADDFVETTLWGEKNRPFLRGFLPYTNGIPSHDTLRDVFATINLELFKICFLAWVDELRDHAERPVHKLDTLNDQKRMTQKQVRGLIWNFYACLKAYRLNLPTAGQGRWLGARFDRIFFRRRTGFATLDRLLARLHANKAALPLVWSGWRFRSTPMAPKTTSAATSHGGNSAPEHAAVWDGTAKMHSSVWPRPATNSASRSEIIWVAGLGSGLNSSPPYDDCSKRDG